MQGEKLFSPQATTYRLQGGMATFKVWTQYDPIFLASLRLGVKEKLCKVVRLDLCIDTSENFMLLVSANVQRGRVQSFGNQLTGYGEKEGKNFFKKSLGSQSAFFKEIHVTGEQKPNFVLHTLYVARPRVIPIPTFYNKKVQACDQVQAQVLSESRIELRLHGLSNIIYQVNMLRGKIASSRAIIEYCGLFNFRIPLWLG